MLCPVCAAPALPRGGACAFCKSPLGDGSAPPGLLDYLAERLPQAMVKRGRLGRGRVIRFQLDVGDRIFGARYRRGRLVLVPDVTAGEWVELMVARLGLLAAADHDLRSAMSRSGWALG